MAVGYKFQSEWILRRGLLLLTAMYVGAVGGAVYLFSTLLNYGLGIVVGFVLLGVGKPVFHLAFLGRPEKFYLMFLKPRTSWISRGFIGLILFLIFGGITSASYILWPWIQDTAIWPIFPTISLGLSLFLVLYDGFVLASCKGIPFWNNSIMPILMSTTAFIAGIACMDALYIAFQPTQAAPVEVERLYALFLVLGVFLVAAFLWVARYIDVVAEKSTHVILREFVAPVFWIAIILAAALPLIAVSYVIFAEPALTILGVVGIIELAGDYLLKYSLLRAGIYRSLVYPWSYSVVI